MIHQKGYFILCREVDTHQSYNACDLCTVASCPNMEWPSLAIGLIQRNRIHAHSDWPSRADEGETVDTLFAFTNQCQSKEITGEVSLPGWKLNRSVFWLNMPIPITLQLSGIRALITSPSHQNVFVHQGKRVQSLSEPLDFIRGLLLFICFLLIQFPSLLS